MSSIDGVDHLAIAGVPRLGGSVPHPKSGGLVADNPRIGKTDRVGFVRPEERLFTAEFQATVLVDDQSPDVSAPVLSGRSLPSHEEHVPHATGGVVATEAHPVGVEAALGAAFEERIVMVRDDRLLANVDVNCTD